MKKFLVLLALAGLFVACNNKEEEPETSAEGTVTLAFSLNANSFMAGETVTGTITDNSGEDVTRGDITVNFSCIDTDAGSYVEETLFSVFPASVELAAGASSVDVDFVLSDDIDQTYNLRIVADAQGCTITGANQNIIVGTAYVVTLSIPEATDNKVYPDDEFTIQAYTEIAPESDLTITLTYTDGAAAYFDALPETVTIEAGQTTGSSATVTAAANDGTGEHEITVSGTADSDSYIVSDYTFTRSVSQEAAGDYLTDETTLYADPAKAFVSSDKEEAYLSNGNSDDYVVMTRADKTDWTVESSAHPTASLADEGWTLLNACEFHYGFNGWGLPSTHSDSWNVNSIRVQNGWSTESTKPEQHYSWQSSQNEKYTDVKSDGYVRIWAAYDQGDITDVEDDTGSGTTRYIGTDSPKCLTGSVLPSWAVFETGTRIEVRARLGGKRQGFAPILRLRGNASTYEWPLYGEIDFMANPVYTDDVEGYSNKVHQAVRWSDDEENYWISDDYTLDVEDWNIYWVEITDGSSLKLGINGQTTYSTTGSGAYWPFCTTFNSSGLYLQVSLGVANAVRDYDSDAYSYLQSADWADSSFKTISYDSSKTSDDTPHMDIDWVRVWRNSNHGQTAGGNGQNSGVYFF